MEETGDATIVFREVQQFRRPWVWVILSGILLSQLGLLVYFVWCRLAFPVQDRATEVSLMLAIIVTAAFLLIFIVIAAFIHVAKLITEVREDGLYYRFYPIHRSFRRVTPDNLKSFRVKTYRPVADYGGWGIRFGRGAKGGAYNMYGNRGVKLVLATGRGLLIGSQRPEEMAEALESVVKRARSVRRMTGNGHPRS